MLKYRLLMSLWLEVLGNIAQHADSDSLEVYYTGSFRKSKAKNYTDLLNIFNQKSFEEAPHPNVPRILARILEDYQSQLGKRHIFRPLLGIMPNRGPRKMSIYVLTDGYWGVQNSLKTNIRSLVNGLSAKNMNDNQIGIQFLRFGNVTDGRKNLEELDCYLGLEL